MKPPKFILTETRLKLTLILLMLLFAGYAVKADTYDTYIEHTVVIKK